MTKSRSVVAPEHIKGKRDDKGHTRKPLGSDGTTPPNVHRGSTSLSWGNFGMGILPPVTLTEITTTIMITLSKL